MPDNQPLEALIDEGVCTSQDGPRGAAPACPPSQIAASRRNALKSIGPGKWEWQRQRQRQRREPSKAQNVRSRLPVDQFATAAWYLAARPGFSKTKLECGLDSKAGSSRVLSEGRWFPPPAGGSEPRLLGAWRAARGDNARGGGNTKGVGARGRASGECHPSGKELWTRPARAFRFT